MGLKKIALPAVLLILGSFFVMRYFQEEPTPTAAATMPREILDAVKGSSWAANHLAVGAVSPGFHHKIAALEARVAEAPNDTAALTQLAGLLQDAHRPAEALSYYQRLVELDRQNRQAWFDLANCHAELAQWNEALLASEKLLAISPNDPQVMYNLGAINANLANFKDARVWWTKVEKGQAIDPDLAKKATLALKQLAVAAP